MTAMLVKVAYRSVTVVRCSCARACYQIETLYYKYVQ